MLSRHRILEFTDGPEAIGGQMLADLGADVVLVEPPGGAGTRRLGPFYQGKPDANTSLPFWATNRGKRSVCVDIGSREGRRDFLKLVREADVLIESRPLQLAECGLGYEQLAAAHPELVVVSITPFGLEGPKARWPATDLTLTAASGVLILTGDEDRPPLVSSLPQAMLHAGAEAAVGALLALEARERDGLGQHVDVSAQTSMMIATQSMVLNHAWNDTEMQRVGGGFKHGNLRGRFVYPCKDGYINLVLLFGPVPGASLSRLFQWMWEEGFSDETMRDRDWASFGAVLASGEEPLSELDRCIDAIDAFHARPGERRVGSRAIAAARRARLLDAGLASRARHGRHLPWSLRALERDPDPLSPSAAAARRAHDGTDGRASIAPGAAHDRQQAR
jgi:crotonobetainyl-CoA:carnitine CoA-transferase CaiB-like acyl-CoA transferase